MKNDLVISGFKLEKHGLTVVGNPSYKDWEEVGDFIKKAHGAVQFWRGDWLNFGENNYDMWTQEFGTEVAAYQTLRNEKWVASRVPMSRRRDNLSWSHHAEVADLSSEEQDSMLKVAEENEIPVSKFRKIVSTYKLKQELQEIPEDKIEKTDPVIFEEVQKIIDASIHAIELLENLSWNKVNIDARDYLLSHLKRAATHYFSLVNKYEQKSLPADMV